MNIRTLIIDDEPLAVMELKEMLKKYAEIEVIDSAGDAMEAIEKIQTLQPQLLFLDINMPGSSGFDLLEQLDHAPHVVFVTAYDEFALQAFQVNALDYLLKPLNRIRLDETVEKLKKYFSLLPPADQSLGIDKKIFIKDGEQCFFVPLAEVFLIESVGNYARFFYQNQKPLLHKSLNYLEERLPSSHFFRASRQQIFNIDFIRNIHPLFNNMLQVELKNGTKVELSQRQSVRFKELMGI
jgi:two-component system LytT family response regulator